jgi:flagellar biosynthesis/type III secretory pathway protein FliH
LDLRALDDPPVAAQSDRDSEPERPAVDLRQLEALFADELNDLREAARKEGLEQGRREGEAAARSALVEEARRLEERLEGERLECEQAGQTLREAAASLSRARESLEGESEKLAVEIGFTALCRILGRNVAQGAAVGPMVAALLAEIDTSELVRIRCSARDRDVIRSALEAERGLSDIPVRADPAMRPAECVMELTNGSLEASLMRQLEQLRDCLLGVWRTPAVEDTRAD